MKGSITASCGHVLKDDEDGEPVFYKGEDCDAIDGFSPCLFSASFCPACVREWRAKGWLFDSQEEAEAWFDSLVPDGQAETIED